MLSKVISIWLDVISSFKIKNDFWTKMSKLVNFMISVKLFRTRIRISSLKSSSSESLCSGSAVSFAATYLA